MKIAILKMVDAQSSAANARLPTSLKLQVSQSDLSAVSVPAQQYTPVAQQYAPVVQQPAPVQGYQPSRYSGPLGLSQAAAAAPAQVPAAAPNPPQPAVPALMLMLPRAICCEICFCYAKLCFHAQEPDKLHCPWHFSWRAGNTQFLCRIHGPCRRSTVSYCFDVRAISASCLGSGPSSKSVPWKRTAPAFVSAECMGDE